MRRTIVNGFSMLVNIFKLPILIFSMDLDKAIKERHTCKRFSTKKVDWREVMEALELARLAPLAGNISTIRFILVQEQDKIQKLAEASQQNFVANASCVVVVCSDTNQITRSYGERATKYARQQAGASIENFLLKIASLGLATCWVGAFYDDQVKSILNIPENIEIEAMFPIGYEMPQKSEQRVKPDLTNIVYYDAWKIKHMGRKVDFRA